MANNIISNISVIIRELMQYKKFENFSELAEFLDISPQTLNNWRSRNTLNVNKIVDKMPELNINWLLTGEGAMLKDEIQRNQQSTIIEEEEPIEYTDYEVEFLEEPESTEGLYPVYEDVVTFGGINGYGANMGGVERPSSYIEDPKGYLRGATACVLHRGDSMKEYPNGIYLAVKRLNELDTRFLIPGEAYIIETEEYRVTKHIQVNDDNETLTLYSTNQECYADGKLIHRPFKVALSDIRGLYRVLRYGITKYGEVVEFK